MACTEPPAISNGYLAGSQASYPSGINVHYVCDSAYTMSGSNTITCNAGVWTGSYPTCSLDFLNAGWFWVLAGVFGLLTIAFFFCLILICAKYCCDCCRTKRVFDAESVWEEKPGCCKTDCCGCLTTCTCCCIDETGWCDYYGCCGYGGCCACCCGCCRCCREGDDDDDDGRDRKASTKQSKSKTAKKSKSNSKAIKSSKNSKTSKISKNSKSKGTKSSKSKGKSSKSNAPKGKKGVTFKARKGPANSKLSGKNRKKRDPDVLPTTATVQSLMKNETTEFRREARTVRVWKPFANPVRSINTSTR